jgi:hypothetical protein
VGKKNFFLGVRKGSLADLDHGGMPDDSIRAKTTSDATFTAATWNVLADGLAQSGGWLYVRLIIL